MANDAYKLSYELIVPPDGIAANSKSLADCAVHQMNGLRKADTRCLRALIESGAIMKKEPQERSESNYS